MNLKDKKIIVLGGTGFLGKHFDSILKKEKLKYSCYSSSDINLVSPTINDNLLKYMFDHNDNDGIVVINLAADCGGIGYNKANPVALFANNMKMILNVFEICKRFDVERLVNIGTVCSYPIHPKLPFKEEEIWNGYPEPTNAPYGIAKKTSLVLSESYFKQYGLNSMNLITANMYGEYDHFESIKGHVIPDLICRFIFAKANNEKVMNLWGTGKPTRDFLYAGDTVKIVLKLLKSGHSDFKPINIGTGQEVSISMLSYYIARQVGFKGNLEWDESKPDGQPRRMLDISKLLGIIGEYKFKTITEGLKKTIDWYLKSIEGSLGGI